MPGKSPVIAAALAGVILVGAGSLARQEVLSRHRNLGKALYENPATASHAPDEFKKALDLAPASPREQVNYGLALLRAGRTREGIAQLEKAQKLDPSIPHTWFNLGIEFKKEGQFDRAAAQFEQMLKLVPDEPVSHYNLGVVSKGRGDTTAALREFQTAARLDAALAAPHFQLYNMYRQSGRAADAARELQAFQEIKKRNENAAIPENMDWSYYAEIYDPRQPAPIRASRKGSAERADSLALDANGDGHADLMAWSGGRIRLLKSGITPMVNTGLEDLHDVVSVAAGDFDNDGLADLCVITRDGAFLYRNDRGRFRKLPIGLQSGHYNKAVWVDYDHDYDLDLILLGQKPVLLRNNGEAGFSEETARFPFRSGTAVDAVVIDTIADSNGFDLAVSYEDHAGILYRDRLAGRYEAEALDALPAGSRSLVARDLDRDGWTDLATGRRMLRNVRGSFQPSPDLPASVDPIDIGKTHPQHWLEVSLTGVKNPRLAANARIEVKAGTLYEKRMYSGVPVLFDLDEHAATDTVRITWPNGLIQNETNQPANRAVTYKEAPRLSGSCPMIFTWNGSRFEFVTDVLGVAPLGASSGDGQYFPVDHDEYVRIPGESLAIRDGQYEIRITEELHEVSYLDQVQLIALDHPSATEIFTNDKFKAPPFPEFRLFGVGRRTYPRRSSDPQFRCSAAGVAELHHLDLDFGNAAPENRAVLLLEGWVDWADGSTFLNAAQQHKDLVLPHLQVKDSAGNWRTVIEDMGIPSGKPKTIAVDLTGKFLSASREIRIATNLCVYWTRIFLGEDSGPPTVRTTAIDAGSSELSFRGFSRYAPPVDFDYSRVSPVSMWNPTPGKYTRYGGVRELVTAADDRMVIMGSGDELRLRFPAGRLPKVPSGWRRDFLLLVDGWAKDGDPNTAYSQSVEPFPFHGMSQYPYKNGENFPHDRQHLDYLRQYNTRPARRLLPNLAE
jgi:tetratricopeptide (TPR) repeat protein